jgi:glutamate racemase
MTSSSAERAPIGVFDSGVGGLTVLRELRRALPHETLLYLGDTARVPYGTKSADTVRRYSLNVAGFLRDRGCRAIVIACNTASAHAFEAVRDALPLPVIDVIRPVAHYIAGGPSRRVAVLGTRGTVQSGAYVREIHALAPHIEVVQQACPLLVPLAEEGWLQGGVPHEVVRTYLAPVFAAGPVDTLVLGCTHYPLLRPVIEQVVLELGGTRTAIVDGGFHATRALMQAMPMQGDGPDGSTHFCVTDDPQGFVGVAERFLGHPIAVAEHVDLH